ncbi:LysR family transcriptional regulator [Alphaproteobacteria bacterium]|nr:LysR family transcriptional regulator [Alphaproteobacteria bacterium]
MKWNINDIPVFVAVAEHEGISLAARKLGMPKSSVSRAISRLEATLGLSLFDRNTRNLRLTDEGQVFLSHASLIVEQAEAASAALAGIQKRPSGNLTVAIPMAFSREIIGGRLAEFSDAYPDIKLDIRVVGHPVNLMTDHIDLSISPDVQEDSDLYCQTLMRTKLIWVSSPAYTELASVTADIASITAHMRFCEQRYLLRKMPILFEDNKVAPRRFLNCLGAMPVNDPVLLRETIKQGGGISFMPDIYCKSALASGELVQILPEIRLDMDATVSALYLRHRFVPQKIRAFIDFARECVVAA